MIKRSYSLTLLPTFLLILLLISACSSSPTGNGGGNGSNMPTPSSGGSKTATPVATGTTTNGGNPSQTVPMPPTQTSCPAAGTARAAVMRPLALSGHQDLVYIYNEVPQNTTIAYGHLRLYDATTGKKSDIVTSGIRIDQAQVSSDGQWVLFLSIPDPRGDNQHSALLQLVRMDGQGLQTLYCFPATTYPPYIGSHSRLPISLQWSVDEKSLLFSVNTGNNSSVTSAVTLLNVSSGALRQLMLDSNDALYNYSLVTWLDNTNAYIIKQGNSGPTPPATIYLMNTATATVANPGLVSIYTTQTRFSDNSLDSSYDGTQLYSSYCLEAASPFNTNISVGPAKGGARQAIFQEQPADCVLVLRAVSPNTLLLLVKVFNSTGNDASSQVWKMSLPGGSMQSLATLTTSQNDPKSYDLNETSQFPWSNVARNGSSYALQAIDAANQTQSILVASLSGGSPNAVATTNSGLSTVSLAGWTTL
jgi:hypothetical protein